MRTIIAAVAQTQLNENGVFELKTVKQYDGKDASTLYQQSLVALSDFVGSDNMSKANIDVSDKDANMIIYKGEVYLGYRRIDALSGFGHNVSAVFTLKVRTKDNKVQYVWTAPSLHICVANRPDIDEIVPLNEIIPEYTHQAQMGYIKKSSLEFAGDVNEHIKQLQNNLENKMKTALDDDF